MTRRFLILGVLSASLSFANDPALLRYLPGSATMLAGIDVEQGKNSPLGQYLLTQWRDDDRGFAEFISTTGFDPRRDLREVVFATLPNQTKNNAVFVAKGTFDISKFLAAAAVRGGSSLVYQGANVITKPNDDGWVAFLDGSTVVGGDMTSVKAAIARRQPATDSLSADTTAKVADLQRRYDAWIYTIAPASGVQGNITGPNGVHLDGEILKGIQSASGGVKFGANVQIGAQAIARSDKDAIALQDVLRFVAGMVQLNSTKPGAAEAAALLQSLEVTTNANLVNVSLQIPEEQLEKMLEKNRLNRPQTTPQQRQQRMRRRSVAL